MIRKNFRNISGILLLDKPLSLSSNQALQKVKRLFNAEKAGHTGSLDPLATGLLPICFGEATKFSRFLLEEDKRYEVVIKLGIKTESGDADGKIILTRPVPEYSPETLEQTLAQFQGEIFQIPSMFSALKFQGQPLYKLARQGLEVKREPRKITIHQLILKSYSPANHNLNLEVHASKGTYIRNLSEDLGEALGCGAHVIALRRLSAGPYGPEQMVSLKELEQKRALVDSLEELDKLLLPLESAMPKLKSLHLSDEQALFITQGRALILPELQELGWIKLFRDESPFIGLGEVLEGGKVVPRRLLARNAMRDLEIA